MEQITEEINVLPTQATQAEIDEALVLLNVARIAWDQANNDFNEVMLKQGTTRKEIDEALEHKQTLEKQYVDLSVWLLENTPQGCMFDREEQRYILR